MLTHHKPRLPLRGCVPFILVEVRRTLLTTLLGVETINLLIIQGGVEGLDSAIAYYLMVVALDISGMALPQLISYSL